MTQKQAITLENVILVDENDKEIGTGEKLLTHLRGRLHRAVSVFLFNAEGQFLLQQRAFSKYHSGGLWSNTCCGHPRPGETPLAAAERRLLEEMGIKCALEKNFDFIYKAELNDGLIEHEFDHVFFGRFDGAAKPDPEEACNWQWIDRESLERNVKEHPERYTVWFKIILERVLTATCPPSRV